MKCPKCEGNKFKLVQSRSFKRRRECLKCKTRFNTIEIIVPEVIKVKEKLYETVYIDGEEVRRKIRRSA